MLLSPGIPEHGPIRKARQLPSVQAVSTPLFLSPPLSLTDEGLPKFPKFFRRPTGAQPPGAHSIFQPPRFFNPQTDFPKNFLWHTEKPSQ